MNQPLWHNLTLVRLAKALGNWLIALGRWELKIWPRLAQARLFKLLVVLGLIISWLLILPLKPWQWLGQRFYRASPYRFTAKAPRQRLSWSSWSFEPRLSLLKPVLSFALLALLIILPLKLYHNYQWLEVLQAKVVGVSQAALGELFNAKSALETNNLEGAQTSFAKASGDFLRAQEQLSLINDAVFVLAKLMPSDSLQLAGDSKNLLLAGQLSAEIGQELTAGLETLLSKNQGKTLTAALGGFRVQVSSTVVKARRLKTTIDEINSGGLPEEYQDEFIILRDQAAFLQDSLDEVSELLGKLQIFLGSTYDRRYLLVFQNNTELRASGGFMGSFATIDFSRGEIKSLTAPKGGTYDTEAGLRVLVQAPQPLQLVNPMWHLWDCNWWPDWPQSAKKIMWFYEKSDGPTVDGVISLTPTVLEQALEIIGPVDMTADYGLVITKDNFLQTVQELSEQKPDLTKEPKKIIGDLLPKIIDQTANGLDRERLAKLLVVLENNLQQKQILFYFQDQDLQQKTLASGWGGEIKSTDYDYLQVVNTNIAGGKSDRDIRQTIYLDSLIRPDGSIINELTIERQHQGVKGEQFSGVRNVNWLRIYVPAGAQLISASGFREPQSDYFEKPDPNWQTDPELANEESAVGYDPDSGAKIYQEQDNSVFANWSMVDPGETAIIRLSYKLPFKLSKQPTTQDWLEKFKTLTGQTEFYHYSLLVQKQPGIRQSEFYYNLETQNSLQEIWRYPEQAESRQLTDQFFAYIYK